MKTALILSGQPRHIELSMSNIKKNILDHNDVDIFLHSWFDKETIGEKYDTSQPNQEGKVGEVQPDTDSLLLKTLSPIKFIIEKQRIFLFTKKLKTSLTADQEKIASLFYSMWKANELKRQYEKEKDFKYDCVVRLRLDLHYSSPVRFDDFSYHLDHIITTEKWQLKRMNNIPGLGDYTLDDNFAISSSGNMDKYFDTFNHMKEFNAIIDVPFAENYLGYNVRKIHNMPIATIPIDIEIIHRIV